MNRTVKNIGASIRQRLKDKGRSLGIPFDQMLQRYGIERFLLRLSKSEHREKFILKGGQMLLVWSEKQMRPTMDIDFMGITENSINNLKKIMVDLCSLNHPDEDGLLFNPDSVIPTVIKEDAEYEGIRVTFEGVLDSAKIYMQIDTGFNDTITPDPKTIHYPSILEQEKPELRGYNMETLIAEKYEAMVKLGELNSRMKDFFDIWVLSSQFAFEQNLLATALKATFERRNTELGQLPAILCHDFEYMDQKQKQWSVFLKKSKLVCAPNNFSEVTAKISRFITPILDITSQTDRSSLVWNPPGPWSITYE